MLKYFTEKGDDQKLQFSLKFYCSTCDILFKIPEDNNWLKFTAYVVSVQILSSRLFCMLVNDFVLHWKLIRSLFQRSHTNISNWRKSIHLLMRNINFRWSVFVRDATSFAYSTEALISIFYSCVRTFCSVTDLIMNDSTEKKNTFQSMC